MFFLSNLLTPELFCLHVMSLFNLICSLFFVGGFMTYCLVFFFFLFWWEVIIYPGTCMQTWSHEHVLKHKYHSCWNVHTSVSFCVFYDGIQVICVVMLRSIGDEKQTTNILYIEIISMPTYYLSLFRLSNSSS